MPRTWITRAAVHHNTGERYDRGGFAGFVAARPHYKIDLQIETNDPDFVDALWAYFHGEGVEGDYGTQRRALPPRQRAIAPTPTPPTLPEAGAAPRTLRAASDDDGIQDAEFWEEGDEPE